MAGCKLFVGNIPEEVRKPELRTEFEKYGRVADLYVNTGFCYVTFDDAREGSTSVTLFPRIFPC